MGGASIGQSLCYGFRYAPSHGRWQSCGRLWEGVLMVSHLKGGQGRDPEDLEFSAWVLWGCGIAMLIILIVAALLQ